MNVRIEVPEKLFPMLSSEKRFIILRGGRGSGKSWTIADLLLSKGIISKKRVLCTREIQRSIKDSVHKLLKDRIAYHKLESFYTVTENSIIGINGTEFIFKGLRHNIDDIKSMEGIDYCWIEEAQSISRNSLEVLIPTIRKEGSQIIFSYNPTDEDDPVHHDFTLHECPDTLNVEINYDDNPWFPEVLRKQMEWDKTHDYDKYLHIWRGLCQKHSQAQVFYGKWRVDSFDVPPGTIFYQGVDWGFSVDATAAIRCFIVDKTLYINQEAYGSGVDIDQTPALFETIPGFREIRTKADSARPETISYHRQRGFNIIGAAKGSGSVKDGIEFIRSFKEVVIDPDCKNTIFEFRNYCYKIDEKTGLVSTVIIDKHNHCIDALRYALEDVNHPGGYSVRKMTGI